MSYGGRTCKRLSARQRDNKPAVRARRNAARNKRRHLAGVIPRQFRRREMTA
jgi:hypothetical protein